MDSPPLGRIGPYILVRELGRGGMGAVYEGRDPAGAPVAVKVLSAPSSDLELLERFGREGRIATSLRHPHLVSVLDAGAEAGRPYLVMELVRGESLDAVVRRAGPLPSRRAAELARDVATGLALVHARGILHRDLKPHNVLLDEASGRARLTDFGLARAQLDARSLTATGQLLGTPAYMAPEQALGRWERVGPPADVYGLGATLYHLLTGGPPFRGASALSVLDQVISKPAAPLGAGVDPALAALVLRCLAKEPAARPDAAGLADALEAWLHPSEAGPARRRPAALALVAAALVAAAAALVGGGGEAGLRAEGGAAAREGGAPPEPLVAEAPLEALPADVEAVTSARAPAQARARARAIVAQARQEALDVAALGPIHELLRSYPDDPELRLARGLVTAKWADGEALRAKTQSARAALAPARAAAVDDLRFARAGGAWDEREDGLQRLLGSQLYMLGRWEEAYVELAACVARAPDDPGPMGPAGIAARNTGRFEVAVELLSGLLARGASVDWRVPYNLAGALSSLERYAEALAMYERAHALGGGGPMPRLRQCEALFHLGDLDGVERALEGAAQLAPHDASVLATRVKVLFLRRRPRSAEELARAVLARRDVGSDPRVLVLLYLAEGYARYGQPARALSLLEELRASALSDAARVMVERALEAHRSGAVLRDRWGALTSLEQDGR